MAIPNPSAMARGRRWLVVVIVFAVVVHGAAFLMSPSQPSPDAAEYLALGKNLATTGALVLPAGDKAKRMPLYPLLIAGVYKLLGDEHVERGVRAVQCVLAVVSTMCIALTANRLGGSLAGLIAGVVSALYAPFIYLQTVCLTETLTIFLFGSSVLVYVGYIAHPVWRTSLRLILISGLLALAALTRANAAILLVPFVLDGFCRASQWRVRLARSAVLLVPTIVCLGAWGLRNWRQIGEFTISTSGGLNLYLGHNPQFAEDPGLADADYSLFDRLRSQGHSEIEADRILHGEALAFAAAHPGLTLHNTLRKVVVYFSSSVQPSAPSLLVICFAALAFWGWRGGGRMESVGRVAFAALLISMLVWIVGFLETYQPWVSPAHLVPIGLVALVALRSQPRVRGLFIGLYVAEMLIGLAFIPLARLRWTVDGMLVIALAIGVSNLCRWLAQDRRASADAHDSAELPK